MSAWVDASLLLLLIGLPGVGLLFVAVMPATDRIALRHAGLGTTILTGVLSLRAAWVVVSDAQPALELATTWFGAVPSGMMLTLDMARVPALLGITVLMPMTLRAGAPRILEHTKGYVVLLLAFEALALLSLLSAHALLTLALMDASLVPLLLLLGLFGGPSKGSATLSVGMSWLLVDALAFAALAWLAVRADSADAAGLREAARDLGPYWQLVLFTPVALAAGLRLAVAPACAWFVTYLREAPVSAAASASVVVMPLGAHLFVTFGIGVLPEAALWALPTLGVLAAGTALLGGLLAVIERDLRLVVAGAGLVHGGVALLGLASLEPAAVSAAVLFLPVMGAATAFLLFCVDALERRYVTRDSTELFGVADELPGLWRLSALALVGVAGLPLVGGGALLVPLLAGVLRTDTFARAGLAPSAALGMVAAVAFGFVLLAAAAVIAVRRLSSPHFRQEARARSSFSGWQAVRLWVPAALVVLAGVFSPLLQGRVTKAVAVQLPPSSVPLPFAAPLLEETPPTEPTLVPEQPASELELELEPNAEPAAEEVP